MVGHQETEPDITTKRMTSLLPFMIAHQSPDVKKVDPPEEGGGLWRLRLSICTKGPTASALVTTTEVYIRITPDVLIRSYRATHPRT
jgi:hypothetical protein